MSVFYEPENYRRLLLLLLLSIVGTCAVFEQDESVEEIMDDIIHSDLPFFGNGGDNVWPRHFENEDSFGCTSRVAFGDWVLRESDVESERESDWYRFSNYGGFHCRANVSHAYTPEALEHAQNHPSFFVRLGELNTDDRPLGQAQTQENRSLSPYTEN